MRRLLEPKLDAPIGVMNQRRQVCSGASTVEHGHLQRVGDEIGGHRRCSAPADDHPRVHVGDERRVREPGPCRHVGEVAHPQLVRSGRLEASVHQIRRPRRGPIRTGRDRASGACRPANAQLTHQPGDPILVEVDPMLAAHRGFHLAAPIDPIVRVEHLKQLRLDHLVGLASGAHRARHRRSDR